MPRRRPDLPTSICTSLPIFSPQRLRSALTRGLPTKWSCHVHAAHSETCLCRAAPANLNGWQGDSTVIVRFATRNRCLSPCDFSSFASFVTQWGLATCARHVSKWWTRVIDYKGLISAMGRKRTAAELQCLLLTRSGHFCPSHQLRIDLGFAALL